MTSHPEAPLSAEAWAIAQASPVLAQRRIILGVTGSIAAYKAVLLLRALQQAGASVRVCLTPSAKRFVGEATFAALSQAPVYHDLWATAGGDEPHVTLSRWGETMFIAPASRHSLARLAHGLCDEPVSATAACMQGPLVLAPAMHNDMWRTPATARVLEQLQADQHHIVPPEPGRLASGEHGEGRLAALPALLHGLTTALSPQDLQGKRVLVTAGPTCEDADPVRVWTNRATGQLGYALAQAAARRGATVTLITGPTALPVPPAVTCVAVRNALDMQAAVQAREAAQDAIVMNAAVADYRPAAVATAKIRKGAASLALSWCANPDILQALGQARGARPAPLLVGFAAESGDLAQAAADKRRAKGVDVIVANPIPAAFGAGGYRALWVDDASEPTPIEAGDKAQAADRLLTLLCHALRRNTTQTASR
ncbi:MAG: bifunctional phosphopantothenoylcysteine decarboxylase/phosphopantothenate--cysteine ligase CoaBC [Polyangiales bacterium]